MIINYKLDYIFLVPMTPDNKVYLKKESVKSNKLSLMLILIMSLYYYQHIV